MGIKKLILIICLSLFTIQLHAQEEQDDFNYDPFADYSEFEASEEEEADIHFFKHGRFFNLALMLGGRMWTGTLGEVLNPAPSFGFYLAYFFNIRSALQLSYTHSTHNLVIPENTATGYDGDTGAVSLSNLAVHYKYYFNTANITRGFANLNPFLTAGFSINNRGMRLINEDVINKSDPTGLELGGGIEIPISRNKMYLGLQVLYHRVTFPDEGDEPIDQTGEDPAGLTLEGDYVSTYLTIGINF